jgi:hypothetical protein
MEDLNCLDPNWWNSPGTPSRYIALGADLLGLYQQWTGGGTLNVTYARAPLALVNPTDAPETPEEYHPRLVEYGIYRMRHVEGGQELEKALKYLGGFFEGAKHYAAYVRSRNLGSRYDKVPFELEKLDLSKVLRLRRDLPPARKAAPLVSPGE